jgi:hypothetical protein
MEKLLAVVFIKLHESLLASAVVKYHALDYHRKMTFGRGLGLTVQAPQFCVAYLPWALKIKENYDNILFSFI